MRRLFTLSSLLFICTFLSVEGRYTCLTELTLMTLSIPASNREGPDSVMSH